MVRSIISLSYWESSILPLDPITYWDSTELKKALLLIFIVYYSKQHILKSVKGKDT